jgi:hypothetical protein
MYYFNNGFPGAFWQSKKAITLLLHEAGTAKKFHKLLTFSLSFATLNPMIACKGGQKTKTRWHHIMKKLSGISVLVSTVALAGLVGCASDSGSNSSQSQPAATAQTAPPPQQTPPPPPPKPKKKKGPLEDRLVVGMSMDDVKAACGNPRNEAMNSDGSATWMYDNGQNAFIPYYSETGHKIHHVTIFFDNNSKVKSWTVTDTGMY